MQDTGFTSVLNAQGVDISTRRRHSALDRRTPDAVYFEQAAIELAA